MVARPPTFRGEPGPPFALYVARLRATVPTGERILLVEDDPELRRSTARLLRAHGHEVTEASNPEECLAAIAAGAVHCILLDFFLVGTTAEELLPHLRAVAPDLPVVLVTGYAAERSPLELVRGLDIQGFHDKSDGPERLLLWVEIALKQSRAARLRSGATA